MRSSGRGAAVVLAFAVAAIARTARADVPAETPPAAPPVIVAVDFDRIPRASLPPMPAAADVPPDASDAQEPGVSVQKVKLPPPRPHPRKRPPSRKLASGLAAKNLKIDVVSIAPDHPEVGAMYAPDPAGTDFSGESIPSLACHRDQPASPLRWESLTVGDGAAADTARVDVKDLWFQSPTCSVRLAATTPVTFAAIATDGTKPWLYAVRDDRSVTFLFARATDVTVDAVVGAPVTVQGGFTRVSLPLGRWGATSFVAHLPSLDIAPPPAPAPPAHAGKAQATPPKPAAPTPDPVEIGVELVQTMSENSPTLLVRR